MTVRRSTKSFPKYQTHKPTGRAFVWWQKKRHYLGKANSPESFEAYSRFIAELAQSGGRSTVTPSLSPEKSNPSMMVVDLMAAYLLHVKDHISKNELDNLRYSLRQLRKLYGHTPVDQFGPKALKLVRQAMIEAKLSRKVINQRIGRIKRMFKWGVAEEMVPPAIFHALQAVDGLRKGRTKAPDRPEIPPVPDEHVDALIPFLSPVNAAMVKVQRLSAMRPGEVCRMRPCDIDRSGEVWLYRPTTHKTQWKGKNKIIPLGPKAQEVLKPFLDRPDDKPLFTPEESYYWLRDHPVEAPSAKGRRAPVYPSELRRREKAKSMRRSKQKRRKFQDFFTTESYGNALENGIMRAKKAGVQIPLWAPNQLRHSRATEIRRDHGLEAAQVVLGHAKADVTQVYAERDLNLAIAIAKESG